MVKKNTQVIPVRLKGMNEAERTVYKRYLMHFNFNFLYTKYNLDALIESFHQLKYN